MKLIAYTATVLLASFVLCGVDCLVREALAQRVESLSGFTYHQHLLWTLKSRSPIDCHRVCMSHDSCAAFTFTQGTMQGTCRGHTNSSSDSQNKTASSMSTTYLLPSRIALPGSSNQESQPPALYSHCNTAQDCLNYNSSIRWICLDSECICRHGYYYSNSTGDCVRVCSATKLLDNFIEYSDNKVISQNVSTLFQVNVDETEDCEDQCLSTVACGAINYIPSSQVCWGFTPDDSLPSNAFANHSEAIFRIRMCQ